MKLKEKQIVTIEKWYSNSKKFWYWIVDTKTGEGIDGFNKKWQALDFIKKQKLVRSDKSVKERK